MISSNARSCLRTRTPISCEGLGLQKVLKVGAQIQQNCNYKAFHHTPSWQKRTIFRAMWQL